MKKYIRDYIGLLSFAGAIVLLDQFTKRLIENNLGFGEVFMPDLWLSQYVRLVNWHNTGAAFGMFQNMSPIFTGLAVVVAGIILVYYTQVPRHEWALRLAMCFQLGGALGNLVDRLRQGYVTDFVSVGNFPVFNVADASISTGVAVLFIGLWISERKQAKNNQAAQSEGVEEGQIIPDSGPISLDAGHPSMEEDHISQNDEPARPDMQTEDQETGPHGDHEQSN